MSVKKTTKVLDSIESPSDLSGLSIKKLTRLSGEVRAFIISTINKCGGHFGSNLGVVELTVALHHVFEAPRDKIVWDVGHQAYAHKVLTGRRDQLHSVRQKNGLSPFPHRAESVYDTFGTGHSSTSISAALGMAMAHDGKKNAPKAIAIIGDGALSGGMAFEALNHAGDVQADILVILNDNKMSISPNVGGMHKYLTRLISSPKYLRVRNKGKAILSRRPRTQEVVRRAEEYAKGMITPGTLFEELGFGYYGPVDGHDMETLVKVLKNLRNIKGPRFLHVVTKKGKGVEQAEMDGLSMHSISGGEVCDEKVVEKNNDSAEKKQLTYTEVFSHWICDTAENDDRLHAVTPAMREGSGLVAFHQKYSDRYHDVGIAEQHAVTFAAGLATELQKPVVAIYSTFMQRAYDQVIHDVALQNLDVTFAIDRAGVVGPDGATHAGSFDFAYLRTLPNMIVMAPADEDECAHMLMTAYQHEGPAAVRYPREKGIGVEVVSKSDVLTIGKGKIIHKGKKVAVLAWGAMVCVCAEFAYELDVTLVNMRFVKPLDELMLKKLAKNHDIFITVEDACVLGSAGSAVNEFVCNNRLDVFVKNFGLPDRFIEHGTREEVLAEAGLNAESLRRSIAKICHQ